MDFGSDAYSTNYGAGGGANAGGFMGGDTTSSPAGGKVGGYGKDTLRPVTIKQLVDAYQKHPDADFIISNQEISQVTFIGQVRNISTQATNHTYKLDDGTGTMEVKQWIDTDALNSDLMDTGDGKSTKIEEGDYCRVYGKLKSFNNKKHVGSHCIRSINDYNEINFHLLEATYVHLFLTRGPPTKNEGGAKAEQNQEPTSNGKAMPSMSGVARKVFDMLSNAPGEEGFHVQNIATTIHQSATEAQKACEELLGLGLIYTTVDDYTYALM